VTRARPPKETKRRLILGAAFSYPAELNGLVRAEGTIMARMYLALAFAGALLATDNIPGEGEDRATVRNLA